MLKLQKEVKVNRRAITRTIVIENYSKEQIDSLFELAWYQPVCFYKKDAKKLFNLRLSFEDSKYLLHEVKLSVDEIVKCYNEFRVEVEHIRENAWTKNEILNEIPNIISLVSGIDNFKSLIKKLTISDINTLFGELKLSYNDTISLVNCGYKVNEIKTLIQGKISCSELVDLARAIETSEVYSLFKENKQNLVFLLSVRNILKNKIEDLDSAIACYKTLYDTIPNSLCQSIITITRSIPPAHSSASGDLTYEEILIHYMNLAGGEIVRCAGYADLAVPVLFKVLEKTIRFFRSSKFIDELIPVKPFLLAAIWCSLDMSLEKQYLKHTESVNLEVVGRSIIAFLVSSMCGLTGYFHSGGAGLPFPNITSYIKTYFNTQHLIKDHAPKVYNKIPRCLIFDTNQAFEDMIKEKQISAGQGLSMVYTFRVGNAFLCNLLGNHILSFESAKNIFKSLWPLPQEAESIRMYFIYSGIPIYSKLNLKDVFVSIS